MELTEGHALRNKHPMRPLEALVGVLLLVLMVIWLSSLGYLIKDNNGKLLHKYSEELYNYFLVYSKAYVTLKFGVLGFLSFYNLMHDVLIVPLF